MNWLSFVCGGGSFAGRKVGVDERGVAHGKKEFGDGKDILIEEKWEQLKDTEKSLQPFYQATLEGQQKFASLDQALFFMNVLFKHFEEAKVRDPISGFEYTYSRLLVVSICR